MFTGSNAIAALLGSAAFLFSAMAYSQAPIVDSSMPASSGYDTQPQYQLAPAQPMPMAAGGSDGDLFFQLQQLQQEMMELRGIVEQQAHELSQLKQQSMDRYIDVDNRLAELVKNPPATTTGSTATAASGTAVATSVASKKPMEGEKPAYDAAYGLVKAKRFDDALEAFKQFLVDYPDGRYAPNSYYWMGELYQVTQPPDLEAARQSFAQLLAQYPNNPKVPGAMYKLGKVYYQKGNKAKSKEWLDKVIADYGNGVSSAADKAQQFLNANF